MLTDEMMSSRLEALIYIEPCYDNLNVTFSTQLISNHCSLARHAQACPEPSGARLQPPWHRRGQPCHQTLQRSPRVSSVSSPESKSMPPRRRKMCIQRTRNSSFPAAVSESIDNLQTHSDIGERTRSSFRNGNIDNEMRCSGNPHNLRPQSHRQHFCSVQPSGAVQHAIVPNNEEVDSKDRKPLADSIVGILELPLHDRRVDLNQDDPTQTGEDHLSSPPLIRQPLRCDGIRGECTCSIYCRQRQHCMRLDSKRLVIRSLEIPEHVSLVAPVRALTESH